MRERTVLELREFQPLDWVSGAGGRKEASPESLTDLDGVGGGVGEEERDDDPHNPLVGLGRVDDVQRDEEGQRPDLA